MKKLVLFFALLMSSIGFASIAVSEVKVVETVSPFGRVVLDVKASGVKEGGSPFILMCTEVETGKKYLAATAQWQYDAAGTYTVTWDMAKDGIRIDNKAVTFKVQVAPYLVIDLTGGTTAGAYSVTGLLEPPAGGWTNEYKTNKLVLRRIEAGSFKMNGSYDVTISKPFYMGVFEVTQKQYTLVMGSNPSSYKGDTRPVESVSWNTIRGNSSTYNWPNVKTVDANSFMGKIRAKTGLSLDLPTEAQWEYACRAGTTSDYNNGGSSEADLKKLGRYYHNGGSSSKHATVGSYQANAWGLYDMHGNVLEWCLDWYDNLSSSTDPVGPASGFYRCLRGGHWNCFESSCTSSHRIDLNPSDAFNPGLYGFRLAWSAGQ